jgi:hypothetical protein
MSAAQVVATRPLLSQISSVHDYNQHTGLKKPHYTQHVPDEVVLHAVGGVQVAEMFRAGQARVGVTLLGAHLLVQALVQVFRAEMFQLLLTDTHQKIRRSVLLRTHCDEMTQLSYSRPRLAVTQSDVI